MTINVPLEITEFQAFHLLCKILGMSEIMAIDEPVYIVGGKVCTRDVNLQYHVVDDRADLFAALRNVANNMVPSVEFRTDAYITNYGHDKTTL
jgi:hypothetical protein